MFQTIQAVPDSASPSPSFGMDKGSLPMNLPGGPNTFHSQFLAAMPEPSAGPPPAGPGLPQPPSPRAPAGTGPAAQPRHPGGPARPDSSATPGVHGPDRSQAGPNRSQANLDRSDRSQANLDRSDRSQPNLDRSDRSQASLDRSDRSQASLDRSDRSQASLDRSQAQSGQARPEAQTGQPGTETRAANAPAQAGDGQDPARAAAAEDQDPSAEPNPAQAQDAAQAGDAQADSTAADAAAAAAAAAAAWLIPPGPQAAADAGGTAPSSGDPGGGSTRVATANQPAGQTPADAAQAAALAKAAGTEDSAAAKAQAALEQTLPDGTKVQFQFGDAQPQATRKPALSEFMNQLKPQMEAPTFTALAASPGDGPAAGPAPAGHPEPQGQAALTPLLTGAPLAKDNGPDPVRAPGNFSPVEALGAGAAPGAATATRVTAPSALDPTPARHENPMTQVDSTIKWMIRNHEQSAELQLHPENLGRVQVKLTVDGTEVHARLWASDSAALPILQEHRGALEQSLRNQGLHLGSFDLQHGQQGQQTPLPRPEPALPPLTFQAGPAELGQETPAPMAPVSNGTSRISIVA